MAATGLKLPETLDEDELLVLPATWEEYLAVVEHTPFTLQFLNGEVIGSQAGAEHEILIPVLGGLFGNYFYNKADYWVLGSNIKIAVKEGYCDFNADLSVLKLPVNHGASPIGQPWNCQIKNPEIVVDVLSKSTQKFDRGEKLNYYKLIPALEHILFVEQNSPFVSVYSRTAVADEWLNHDYRTLESIVRLGELELPMAHLAENGFRCVTAAVCPLFTNNTDGVMPMRCGFFIFAGWSNSIRGLEVLFARRATSPTATYPAGCCY